MKRRKDRIFATHEITEVSGTGRPGPPLHRPGEGRSLVAIVAHADLLSCSVCVPKTTRTFLKIAGQRPPWLGSVCIVTVKTAKAATDLSRARVIVEGLVQGYVVSSTEAF